MSSSTTGNPTSPPNGVPFNRRIGPYLLLHIIGEGGFGIVWKAERVEPYRQDVAIKMIKPGMGSEEVLARFEHERQALALMRHPAVAAVLDGGVAPPELGERPYFVMEYVPGTPITDYCDEHRLSIRARLELFAHVCEGVQHAHSKGIIHRDLTPRNILVVEHDNKPQPKIIDFGISKALGRPLTDKIIFTHDGRMMGVPEYISPEQAQGLDVDTRADVYSLGVLLYELLTGSPPFDRHALLSRGWEAMLRFIREAERPHPSTRLSSLGRSADEVARRRGVEPRKLTGELSRGLGWIPLKALEPERSRRYQTPLELVGDIRRYLNDDYDPPFGGRTLDRLRRFTRRNRRTLAVTALIILALVAWLAGTMYQLDQTRVAEAREMRSAYGANIAAAAASIASDNCISAREHLDACPTKLRSWEWRWLRRQSDSATATGSTNQLIETAEYSDDGSRIRVLGKEFAAELGTDLTTRLDTWAFRRVEPPVVQRDPAERLIRLTSDGTAILSIARVAGRWEFRTVPRSGSATSIPINESLGSLPGRSLVCAAGSGHRFALAGRTDQQAFILLVSSGAPSRRIPLDAAPSLMAMSNDGRRLAAAFPRPDAGCLCRVWRCDDLAESEFVAPPFAIGEQPLALHIGDGEGPIVVAGSMGAVCWRDPASPPSLLRGFRGAQALATSPDRTWVAAGAGNRTLLYNLLTGDSAVLRGHVHDVSSVTFSPDSGSLLSTTLTGSIRTWRVRADMFQYPAGRAGGCSASTDGGLVAVFNPPATGGVRIFDTRGKRWSDPFAPGSVLRRACLSADGSRLAVADDNALTIYAVQSHKPLFSVSCEKVGLIWDKLVPDEPGDSPSRMVFVPGAPSSLAIVLRSRGVDGQVVIVNLESGEVRTLAVFPDGFSVTLATSGPSSLLMAYGNTLRHWGDAPALVQAPREFVGDFRPAQFLVSADDGRALGVNLSGEAWRFSLDSSVFDEHSGHAQGGRAACVLRGQNRLITGGRNGSLVFWSIEPFNRIASLPNPEPVVGLCFNPETSTLWVAFEDGSLQAFAAETLN